MTPTAAPSVAVKAPMTMPPITTTTKHMISTDEPMPGYTLDTGAAIIPATEASATPMANTTVWIVSADGQPCPVGVPGEIWIGGATNTTITGTLALG